MTMKFQCEFVFNGFLKKRNIYAISKGSKALGLYNYMRRQRCPLSRITSRQGRQEYRISHNMNF